MIEQLYLNLFQFPGQFHWQWIVFSFVVVFDFLHAHILVSLYALQESFCVISNLMQHVSNKQQYTTKIKMQACTLCVCNSFVALKHLAASKENEARRWMTVKSRLVF